MAHRIDIPTGSNTPSSNSSIEINTALSNANVIQSNTGNPSSTDCWWYRYWVCILNCITIIAESWSTVESIFTFSQIVASIVILVMARHDNPQAPLFAWVVGCVVGCATSLGMLYKNHILSLRLYRLVNDYLECALLLFFDIWFVLGNIWVFRYLSSHQAPKLFSLCVVFLSFSYIWYAMIIISLVNLLIIQDHGEIEGATSHCINAMPTYIFKLQRNASHNSVEINPQVNEGGIMAAGTEKERVISGDDAECSICLARYEDNDSKLN